MTILPRRALLLGTFAAVLGGCAPDPPPPPGADTVVLVHGLGRTPASMLLLQTRLEDDGYRVVNFGYPSRSETLESLVARLDSAVQECCARAGGDVHFVTHSMGGLLVRGLLRDHRPARLGRVVMLAPPNQGSEVVDALTASPLLATLLGPAGARLGTDSAAVPAGLGPVDFPLGVITGTWSLNPIGSFLIPGPDDGKVAVARAPAEGTDDFLVLDATHTFIMNRPDVAEQVVQFLRHGRFREDVDAG